MRPRLLFFLSLLSFVFSCRNIPENEKQSIEDTSLKTHVLLNINIIGAEWENSNLENTLVPENNLQGGGVIL